MILKAKFSLTTAVMKDICAKYTDDKFFVEPASYDGKQCFVVGEASPIMYLIGDIAARGNDGLLSVLAV